MEAVDADRAPSGAPLGADELAQALRLQIQRSELLAGEWLREVRLSTEFGVGRSCVRKALRILADDGLIELQENRGARVSTTSAEEIFDLYEVRAALYGLAARFACLRASPADIADMLTMIDALLAAAEAGTAADEIIGISEAIFSTMSKSASVDAQRMIESIRRKTRWHFSYVALALSADGPGPYPHWRTIRAALVARDADAASEAARRLIYYMQDGVTRLALAHGGRRDQSLPTKRPLVDTENER